MHELKKWNIQGQYNFQAISRAAYNNNCVTRLRKRLVSLSTSTAGSCSMMPCNSTQFAVWIYIDNRFKRTNYIFIFVSCSIMLINFEHFHACLIIALIIFNDTLCISSHPKNPQLMWILATPLITEPWRIRDQRHARRYGHWVGAITSCTFQRNCHH